MSIGRRRGAGGDSEGRVSLGAPSNCNKLEIISIYPIHGTRKKYHIYIVALWAVTKAHNSEEQAKKRGKKGKNLDLSNR